MFFLVRIDVNETEVTQASQASSSEAEVQVGLPPQDSEEYISAQQSEV